MNFKEFLKYTDYSNPFNPWKDEWKRKEGEPKKLAGKFIVLGKDETFSFIWGDNQNLMPWRQVLEKASQVAATSPFLKDDTGILLTPEGNVVINSSTDDTKWSGRRNQYTRELPKIVKELLKRHIINKSAKIFSGNWAGQRGEFIETAEEILRFEEYPEHLVLYHGTNDRRWDEIKINGLTPMPVHQRQWKGRADRGHPEYRDQAVYLTASPMQAITYAKKAVTMASYYGYKRTYPVILKIIVKKQDFDKLRADDDYLEKMGGKGDPLDWRESLSFFGQIAFVGNIPPEQIEIYRTLNRKDIWKDSEQEVP